MPIAHIHDDETERLREENERLRDMLAYLRSKLFDLIEDGTRVRRRANDAIKAINRLDGNSE